MKPTKRQFIPSFDTYFENQKRLKSINQHEAYANESCNEFQNPGPLNSNKFHDFPKEPHSTIQNSRVIYKAKPNKVDKSFTTSSRSFSIQDTSFYSRSQRPLTMPKPFNLSTNNKAKQTTSFHQSSEFIAREMPDFSVPFSIKPREHSANPNFSLNLSTASRADQREIFNEKLLQKDREMALAKQQELESQKFSEQEQLKLIRKHMEFKANPLKPLNFFVPKPSQVPLTIPVSPVLQTELRSIYRSN